MDLWYTAPGGGFTGKVKLNQNGTFVAHYPAIMPRLHNEHLRGDELQRASVCVLNIDLPARQKAQMHVHAEVGAGNLLHVSGPTKSWRIDNSLDTADAGRGDIELESANLPVFSALHGGE
jgi:hypothetical protein